MHCTLPATHHALYIYSHSSCTAHYQLLGTNSKTFAVTALALYISGHSARAVNFQSLSRHRTYPAIQHALHNFTHSAGAVQHCHSLNNLCKTPATHHVLYISSHLECRTFSVIEHAMYNIFSHSARAVRLFQSLNTYWANVSLYALYWPISISTSKTYMLMSHLLLWLSQYSRLFSQSDASNHEFTECARIN